MKNSQDPIELAMFQQYIKQQNIISILEIGSRYGETLVSLAKAMPKGSRIVSIDLPDGPWGRSDSKGFLQDNIKQLNERGYEAYVFFGDSKDSEIIKSVDSLGKYDLIFIDGDHKLSGVEADWLNYKQMGTHIGFHDINTTLDVPFFWNQLKEDFDYVEFINPNASPMGIGILDTRTRRASRKGAMV